jgi:hypothetical protein
MLARGGDASAASAAAAESASHNGGQLKRCSCIGTRPTVEVRVGDATSRARAEIRFECFADPERC